MKDLKEFLIQFVGLKEGLHHFDYHISDKFFEFFQFDDFENIEIDVKLDFQKKSTMFILNFKSEGKVNVLCDVSGEPFDLDVVGDLKLIVKFGEEFNDDDEEILIIPHNEFQIDVAQYIFEMIVLSIPQKRIHPGVATGEVEVAELKNEKEENKEEIDPRWEKLKQIQTNKKD